MLPVDDYHVYIDKYNARFGSWSLICSDLILFRFDLFDYDLIVVGQMLNFD